VTYTRRRTQLISGFALAALLLTSACGRAEAAPPTTWAMDGYGTVLTISGGQLRLYQTTAVSCLPDETATKTGPGTYASKSEDVFTVNGSTFSEAGDVGTRALHGIPALPAACSRTAAADPVSEFEVFWHTFAENYPFFAAKGVSWQRMYDRYRPQVTATTSPDQLFAIFSAMLTPLHDAHVYLTDGVSRTFAEGKPGSVPPSAKLNAKVQAYIVSRDLHGQPLQEYANGRIGYASLPGGLGYLRVSGFAGYTTDSNDPYAGDAAALDQALTAVFTKQHVASLRGLIIDLRVNGGGSDQLGLTLAGRLTDRAYLAYAKSHRDDPADPARFSAPQPITVTPSSGPVFTGPVAVLTASTTVSAGETFTQALINRPGTTIRVGQPTQGVFSDVMDRTLPNGWEFGLPNEQYATDGVTYDGTGIPPQVSEPVFTDEEFAARRDSAFDAAVRLLG
jgi:hypothetical protein